MTLSEDESQNPPPDFAIDDDVEMARQLILHQRLCEAFGGLVPEQPNLSAVKRVLDVPCGSGGWAIDVARTYPHLQVVGIDSNPLSIQYAQALAWERGLTNISFAVGDLPHLPLPQQPFDLINVAGAPRRFLALDYPLLLSEVFARCGSGGSMRWTDLLVLPTARTALATLMAFYEQYSQEGSPAYITGSIHRMAWWLRSTGFEELQFFPCALEVSAGTPWHLCFLRQVRVLAQHVKGMLLQRGLLTEQEYEGLLTRLQQELRAPTFCGLCLFFTVRATKRQT